MFRDKNWCSHYQIPLADGQREMYQRGHLRLWRLIYASRTGLVTCHWFWAPCPGRTLCIVFLTIELSWMFLSWMCIAISNLVQDSNQRGANGVWLAPRAFVGTKHWCKYCKCYTKSHMPRLQFLSRLSEWTNNPLSQFIRSHVIMFWSIFVSIVYIKIKTYTGFAGLRCSQ